LIDEEYELIDEELTRYKVHIGFEGQIGLNGHVGLKGHIGFKGQIGFNGHVGFKGHIGFQGHRLIRLIKLCTLRVMNHLSTSSEEYTMKHDEVEHYVSLTMQYSIMYTTHSHTLLPSHSPL
jgi:hypothetical protein